ncbi:MAG: nitroreductase [Pirellulaceae bacterium]|nr:nitroreductase [Pirellulaceae bacterium]
MGNGPINRRLSMDVELAIRARRSVRGYTGERVPDETFRHIFELAQHAPSNCNIQPWRVYVASGATRERIRAAMLEQIRLGIAPNPDFDYPVKFDEPYRQHQIACAVALYQEMGIGRDDKPGRTRASLRNFELFDAPHVAFLGMDKQFKEPVALDLGIYLQTLMLTMTSSGIACCPQGSMRSYPDVVRREFGLSPEVGILVGLSFGYEDHTVPANRTRIDRSPLGENVVFKD